MTTDIQFHHRRSSRVASEYKATIRAILALGGSCHCEWELRTGDYYSESCGYVDRHLDGVFVYSIVEISGTFANDVQRIGSVMSG